MAGLLQDPSSNVKASLQAEVKRIDDLIQVGFHGLSEKIDGEIRRIDEKIKIQSEATTSLNFAESKRLDAIRSVDINAVAVASERSSQQASVLANQVTASAETLRALVASTAITVAQQLAVMSNQLSDRISALEKSQYEGIGKGRVVDPQIAELLNEVNRLRNNASNRQGSGEGMKNLWSLIIGGIFLAIGVASILIR